MKITKAKLQTLHRIWTLMNDSGKKKKKKKKKKKNKASISY